MKYIHPEEADIFGIVAAMTAAATSKGPARQNTSAQKPLAAKASG